MPAVCNRRLWKTVRTDALELLDAADGDCKSPARGDDGAAGAVRILCTAEVGANTEHPTLCPRCVEAVKQCASVASRRLDGSRGFQPTVRARNGPRRVATLEPPGERTSNVATRRARFRFPTVD